MRTAQVSSIQMKRKKEVRKEGSKEILDRIIGDEKGGREQEERRGEEAPWAYFPFLPFLKNNASLTILKT